MTCLPFRIKRDGKFQAVDIDQMTDAELDELVKTQPPEQGWPVAIALSKWIRENIHQDPGEAPEMENF